MRSLAIAFVALLLLAQTGHAQQTYADPFAYCAAVRTVDAPDARYSGPAIPDAVRQGIGAAVHLAPSVPAETVDRGTFWRCMNGDVIACFVGANLPCEEKADTSRAPAPALVAYCQAQPNADIPAFVTGRATVYQWQCAGGAPVIVRQVTQPDAAGFIANFWYRIRPGGLFAPDPPVAPVGTLPRTGTGAGGATSLAALPMAALLIGAAALAIPGLLLRSRGGSA